MNKQLVIAALIGALSYSEVVNAITYKYDYPLNFDAIQIIADAQSDSDEEPAAGSLVHEGSDSENEAENGNEADGEIEEASDSEADSDADLDADAVSDSESDSESEDELDAEGKPVKKAKKSKGIKKAKKAKCDAKC